MTKTISVSLLALIAVAVSALDVPSPKEGKLIRIISNKEVVAELRILKSDSITLDARAHSVMLDPKLGEVYIDQDDVSLQVSADGKLVFKLSAKQAEVTVEKLSSGAAR